MERSISSLHKYEFESYKKTNGAGRSLLYRLTRNGKMELKKCTWLRTVNLIICIVIHKIKFNTNIPKLKEGDRLLYNNTPRERQLVSYIESNL